MNRTHILRRTLMHPSRSESGASQRAETKNMNTSFGMPWRYHIFMKIIFVDNYFMHISGFDNIW